MGDPSESGVRSKAMAQLTPQFLLTLLIAVGGAVSTYAVLGYRVGALEKQSEKAETVLAKQIERITTHDVDSRRTEDRLAAIQLTLAEIKVDIREIKSEKKHP